MPEFDLDAALSGPPDAAFIPQSLVALPPDVRRVFSEFWCRFQGQTGATVRDGVVRCVGRDPLDWHFGCNITCQEAWAVEWERNGRPDHLPRGWSTYPPEFNEWCRGLQRAANALAGELQLSTQLYFGHVGYVPNYGVLVYLSGYQYYAKDIEFPLRMPIQRG